MRARVYLRTWHTLPEESAHRSKPRPEDTDFQDVPSRVPKPVRIPARESSQTDRFLSPSSGYRACRRVPNAETISTLPHASPRRVANILNGHAMSLRIFHNRAQPAIAVSTSFTQYDVPIGIA